MSKTGAVVNGEWWTWDRIRNFIGERDNYTCQVCKSELLDNWHTGHIIDRCAGGSDHPKNLLVMCNTCNMQKPIHETREQFDKWVQDGYWIDELLRNIRIHKEYNRYPDHVLQAIIKGVCCE